MKLLPKRYGFSTKEKYIEFEVRIKVSSDFRFYFAIDDIPKELMKLEIAPAGKRVYKDSFYELNEVIEQLIAEYELSLVHETKSKVILYSVEYDESRTGQLLSFKWVVVLKVELKSGKQTDVRYFTERKQSSSYHHIDALDTFDTYTKFENKFLEMIWTVEREAWFQEMERGVTALAKRLKSGFGNRAELLAMRIDQNAKFLIAGASDENQEE